MPSSEQLLEELEPLIVQVARMWISHPRRALIATQFAKLETEAGTQGSDIYLRLLQGIRNSAEDIAA